MTALDLAIDKGATEVVRWFTDYNPAAQLIYQSMGGPRQYMDPFGRSQLALGKQGGPVDTPGMPATEMAALIGSGSGAAPGGSGGGLSGASADDGPKVPRHHPGRHVRHNRGGRGHHHHHHSRGSSGSSGPMMGGPWGVPPVVVSPPAAAKPTVVTSPDPSDARSSQGEPRAPAPPPPPAPFHHRTAPCYLAVSWFASLCCVLVSCTHVVVWSRAASARVVGRAGAGAV